MCMYVVRMCINVNGVNVYRIDADLLNVSIEIPTTEPTERRRKNKQFSSHLQIAYATAQHELKPNQIENQQQQKQCMWQRQQQQQQHSTYTYDARIHTFVVVLFFFLFLSLSIIYMHPCVFEICVYNSSSKYIIHDWQRERDEGEDEEMCCACIRCYLCLLPPPPLLLYVLSRFRRVVNTFPKKRFSFVPLLWLTFGLHTLCTFIFVYAKYKRIAGLLLFSSSSSFFK